MTRTSKLSYLAGLLDTDGFIGLDDGVLYELKYCVRTGITTRKVCKWLQLHFGGNFHRVLGDERVYYWKLTGRVVLPTLLNDLLPFLQEKKSDAEESLKHLNAAKEPELHLLNRREIAAHAAGVIDARGFEGSLDGELEPFFLGILPYLVERKQQVNAILQSIRTGSDGLSGGKRN